MSRLTICVKQKYKGKKKSKGLLSYSPHLLAERLGAYLRTDNIKPSRVTSTLINWGRTAISDLSGYTQVLNHPDHISNASNKLKAFRIMADKSVPTLTFTNDINEAIEWIKDGGWVVCRQTLSGSNGDGIVIAKEVDEIVQAPLYTRYYRKSHEYRYHVIMGKVVDVQQKKRLSKEQLELRGFENRPESYVRNLCNGYIFAREGVTPIEQVSKMCEDAMEALNLDFGGVDVLVNIDGAGKYISGLICEVNTAPGLCGSTLEVYLEEFKGLQSEGLL